MCVRPLACSESSNYAQHTCKARWTMRAAMQMKGVLKWGVRMGLSFHSWFRGFPSCVVSCRLQWRRECNSAASDAATTGYAAGDRPAKIITAKLRYGDKERLTQQAA